MKSVIIILVLFFLTYGALYAIVSDNIKNFIGPKFVAFVVLATLGGTYLPSLQLYFVAIAVLFIGTTRGRLDAACRYILAAAIIPQMAWQIGAVGHFFGVIDSAGVIGFAAYIVGKIDRTGSTAGTGRWTAEDYLVLTIFLIMAIGDGGFVKFNDTLRTWIQEFLLIAMPYILLRSTLKTTAEFRTAIACFGVAAVFLAVFAIFEARMSSDIFDIMTKRLTGLYIKNMDMRDGLMRASASMNGPLALACFLTVGIFALACSRDFFRLTIGYYGALGVAFLGLLMTQSRGSLIAVFLAAVVLSMALRKWGVAAVSAIAGIAGWPLLQLLASTSPAVASFINGGAPVHTGKYFDYRNLLLERGLQVAANHPWTGMRLTQVTDALADITQGEGIVDLVNVYLVILLISGVVGLLPFLGLTVASAARGARGFARVKDPALLRARAFSLAAFTAVLFQFSFMSFIDRVPMVFVLSLFGIRLVVQERQSQRRASATLAEVDPSSAAADNRTGATGAPRDPAPGRDLPWRPQLPMGSA